MLKSMNFNFTLLISNPFHQTSLFLPLSNHISIDIENWPAVLPPPAAGTNVSYRLAGTAVPDSVVAGKADHE